MLWELLSHSCPSWGHFLTNCSAPHRPRAGRGRGGVGAGATASALFQGGRTCPGPSLAPSAFAPDRLRFPAFLLPQPCTSRAWLRRDVPAPVPLGWTKPPLMSSAISSAAGRVSTAPLLPAGAGLARAGFAAWRVGSRGSRRRGGSAERGGSDAAPAWGGRYSGSGAARGRR